MAKKKAARKSSVAKTQKKTITKKAKAATLRRRKSGGQRKRRGEKQQEKSMKQRDDGVSALRSRYLKQLTSERPHGSPDLDKVREALIGAEGICESIAREQNPSNREAMIRATQAALLGAAEVERGMQGVMELFGSFIRERVALAEVGRQRMSPTDDARTTRRTAAPAKHTLASQENRELSDLRADFVERIMEVQRPGPCQRREDTQRFLISLDRTCDSITLNEAPRRREALLRATQAALQSITQHDPTSQPFMGLVTSYVRKRVILQIQSEPPFSDNAPRIALRSLIIPGGETKEGILVKGVSALWFEILRRIKDDPDSIHQIDCWKWEELLAGAYKQAGREKVILTPKKDDKGIDVIVEWRDQAQLRFLLLDQMKAYKPDHRIGPDEIREMKGVLLDHPEASKGLITTTANFTPGALKAAKNLTPRLELRPRDKLLAWLASVAVEEVRSSDTAQMEGASDA